MASNHLPTISACTQNLEILEITNTVIKKNFNFPTPHYDMCWLVETSQAPGRKLLWLCTYMYVTHPKWLSVCVPVCFVLCKCLLRPPHCSSCSSLALGRQTIGYALLQVRRMEHGIWKNKEKPQRSFILRIQLKFCYTCLDIQGFTYRIFGFGRGGIFLKRSYSTLHHYVCMYY